MEIDEIKSTKRIYENQTEWIKKDCAQEHGKSLFYQNDVTNNETNFNIIKDSINDVGELINSVIKKLSKLKTNFNNTDDNLTKIKGSSPDGDEYKKQIFELIKKASEKAFNELKTTFDQNLSSIEQEFARVEQNITFYYQEASEIRQLIAQQNALAKTANSGASISNLSSRIAAKKRLQKTYEKQATEILNQIRNLNTKNQEFLDKGLKRV